MPSPELEEFAKKIVRLVRDQAIRDMDFTLDPSAKGPSAKGLQRVMDNGTPAEFAAALIPDTVDEAVFYLLDAIDNGLKLSFTASNGKTIDLCAEGHSELAGDYLGGADGWRRLYSKQRFSDDFPPDPA